MRLLALVVLLLVSVSGFARGLTFQEEMHGYAYWNSEFRPTSVYLNVAVSDIDAWRVDANHPATVTGYLAFDNADIRPIAGQMYILSPAPSGQGRLLAYRISGSGVNFFGVKHVYDDHQLDLVDDMTTLRGSFKAPGQALPTVQELLSQAKWSSEIRFEWWRPTVLFNFVASFHTTNTWWWDVLSVQILFLKTVLGGLASVFFPWAL